MYICIRNTYSCFICQAHDPLTNFIYGPVPNLTSALPRGEVFSEHRSSLRVAYDLSVGL